MFTQTSLENHCIRRWIKLILYYSVLPKKSQIMVAGKTHFLQSVYSGLCCPFLHCLGKKHSQNYSIILSSCAKPVQRSKVHKSYYICPPSYLLTYTLCKVINLQRGSRKCLVSIKWKYVEFSRDKKKYVMFQSLGKNTEKTRELKPFVNPESGITVLSVLLVHLLF